MRTTSFATEKGERLQGAGMLLLSLVFLSAFFLSGLSDSPDAHAGVAPSPAEGDSSFVPDSLHVPAADSLPADRVIVYYFHRTARCDRCLKFEAYADAALRAGFPGELADGTLIWSVVNIDEERNEAFVDSYDIFESSLVVSTVRDSSEVRWKKLEEIWYLVEDRDAYVDFIVTEVDSALKAVTPSER